MGAAFQNYTDESLVSWLGSLNARIARITDQAQRIEHELRQRMEARHAKEVYHPDWECTLRKPSPQYDISKLRALGEVIPPEVFAKGFTEAHEETVEVAAKFDLRVVNKWARDYGVPVQEILHRAKLPDAPGKLVVKAREK